MERFSLWAYAYNYLKRYRINQPAADTSTHAQVARIPQERVDEVCRQITRRRRFLSHTPIVGEFRRIWLRMMERPFQTCDEYLPRYLLA